MTDASARPFRIRRPWATARQTSERIIRLIAVLAALQFFLNGLNNLLDGWMMLAVWFGCGAIVLGATMRIERYLADRRRFA